MDDQRQTSESERPIELEGKELGQSGIVRVGTLSVTRRANFGVKERGEGGRSFRLEN